MLFVVYMAKGGQILGITGPPLVSSCGTRIDLDLSVRGRIKQEACHPET